MLQLQQLVGTATQSLSASHATVGSIGSQYEGQGARMHHTRAHSLPVGQRSSAPHSVRARS